MTDTPSPVAALLVANRGEIARRVFATCRRLGIGTVAVHSDADRDAAHTREADLAVRLPGDAPADTYLRVDALVRAALDTGAQAVHPGYGFLSENADFARAVTDAGLVWVGPPPEAIEAMASKTRAKRLMAEAGVPLLEPLDPERVTADELPLLVKAAAGGGGRGMRVVRRLDALPGELEAARAEARSAFGDGEVFLEPYVERARHVEAQVLADGHGTVWVLGTRDCTLQRRHQKVVEEAPAPELAEGVERRLVEAAERAARAVDYVGAGTVEFLVDGERVYFLEMNTRLQVEHPVTEAVYDLDLVAWQIAVAEGERLPARPPEPYGHAVEARLYAEDPAEDWRPQTGTLHRLRVPGAVAGPAGRRGLRLDSGVEAGDEIGVHYDPMLAKVVAWAPTRAAAVRALTHALSRARVHGPVTNRDLLVRVLGHPEFQGSRADTGFLERALPELTGERPEEEWRLAALAAALADAARRPSRFGGWRNVPSVPQTKRYRAEPSGREYQARYRLTRDGLHAPDHPGVRLCASTGERVVLEVAGVERPFTVYAHGDQVWVEAPGADPGRLGSYALTALPRFTDPADRDEPGSLLARMPGTVVRVAEGLTVGSAVRAGTPLLWLEAMKMEHQVVAPADGVLTALEVEVGQQVELGATLAVVAEPSDDA
ncbi:biotin carboxylase N-terminal domain-containing protein [Streptomyces sp. NPDC005438]|uniref:acetyl/propionyl/methylcrotonyl-CoA carboxylase subunit alpha n=1 Tax=Streptomyces sp. NPDC005438 TaxID=3156880 RepID=UPI0033B619DF